LTSLNNNLNNRVMKKSSSEGPKQARMRRKKKLKQKFSKNRDSMGVRGGDYADGGLNR